MAKWSKAAGTYSRSHDFPDIGDYAYSELKEACALYRELIRERNTCTPQDIQSHFRCTPQKARMLYGAAEFHEKMRKKGLA